MNPSDAVKLPMSALVAGWVGEAVAIGRTSGLELEVAVAEGDGTVAGAAVHESKMATAIARRRMRTVSQRPSTTLLAVLVAGRRR